MTIDTRTVAHLDSSAKYRVIAHLPFHESREVILDNRSAAMQLLEELAEQGFAVMVSRLQRT